VTSCRYAMRNPRRNNKNFTGTNRSHSTVYIEVHLPVNDQQCFIKIVHFIRVNGTIHT